MAKVVLTDEQLHKIQQCTLEMLLEVDRLCRKHNLKYSLAYGTLIGAIRHKGFIPWDDDIDIWMPRESLNKFKEICKTELNEKFFYQCNETDPNYYLLFDKLRMNGTVFKEDYYSEYEIHHGVYLDIFPIDEIPDAALKRRYRHIVYRFCRLGIQSRYLKTSSRAGSKKILSYILGLCYSPFSLRFLYRTAEKEAASSLNCKGSKASNIFDTVKGRIFEREDFEDYMDVMFEGHKVMAVSNYHKMLTALYGDYMKLPPENERQPHHELAELII
ncbi:MAG: LicD family protein [Clostridiales bacterium]|nr:LicD family protein [Clostridiales bacterium]